MKKWFQNIQSVFLKLEELMKRGGIKKEIVLLVIGGISLLCSLFVPNPFPFDYAWIAILVNGVPIVCEAIIGLVTRFDIKADVLVSMALIASIYIEEYFAAGEVAFIMQLGGLLEDLTVARAQSGIEKLVKLTPQTARVIEGEAEKIVPAEEVQVGDILRVVPGETVPVDGVILSGETSMNEAIMTGESLPVDKAPGDIVSSGTTNQFGAFTMRATKVGEDSSVQRMIRLAQSADANKAKIVTLADKWATWIVIIALAAAILTWLVTGEVIRAVTILVVFCPCALVLATPTAIMAASGNASKHGFLVREGDALERLASVKKFCFDKTGTLTYGTPEVITAKTINGWDVKTMYEATAAAERNSEHPLGKAIVRAYKKQTGQMPVAATDFQMITGQGVSGIWCNKQVLAGNEKWMATNHVQIPEDLEAEVGTYVDQGSTSIFSAIDGQFVGYFILSDTIREDCNTTMQQLREAGVEPVLLTGDHEDAASTIGTSLHITEIISDCLPEDKLNHITAYENEGQHVCMIGDGINDAPALKAATVGIAMGGIGSDIAVEAADIVLIDDEVKELPHLFALAKHMMTTIKCNIAFSMTLNFIALFLAMAGILTPVVGALVHNAGSVLVIINSAFLLAWKKKK